MSTAGELAGLKALLTERGQELLATLPEVTSPAQVLHLTETLRAKGYDPGLIAAALTQVKLRRQAAAKFGPFARDLLYTSAGLQQATTMRVAAHHAKRFQAAGCTHVADLGCGIGSESFSLAGLGIAVTAVDLDEAHAALAMMNLRHFDNVTVRHMDLFDLDFADIDGAFADPARRDERGRRLDPASWHPPLSQVLQLHDKVANLGVKVAPGIDYRYLPPTAHVQWVSVAGNLVEAGIWLGEVATEGPGRSALLLDKHGTHSYVAAADRATAPPGQVEVCTELGEYLAVCDPAIIRAGALDVVAHDIDGALISEQISYLTCKHQPARPGIRAFVIDDVVSANAKKLQTALQARGVGEVEIFSRGSGIQPDALRRRLKLRGDHRASVFLTRVRGKHAAILATSVDSARS